MKEGWEYKTIKDCCIELFAGGDVPRPDVSKNKTKYFTVPIYTNGVENEGLYGYTSNARVFEPAVTISARGTIGATFRRFIPFYPAIRLITAVPNKDVLSIDYLYYALKTLTVGNSGTSIPQLTIPNIKKIVLPVPPLSEQQSIVDYFDSAFAKIDAMKANAEKALNEAKALFQASLKEMLEPKEGWDSMKLGDFAYMKAGDFVKASDIYQDYVEGLYPCYGGNGFRGYVKEPNQEGDFCLIGRQGALCGCVNRAKGVFRTTEHAVIVKPYQDIPTSLVYYMLINLNLNKYATGAAQPGLSVKNIAEQVIIPVPPRNAHFTIATTLDSLKSKVDRLKANYDKISQECDALKQAILRQVFE